MMLPGVYPGVCGTSQPTTCLYHEEALSVPTEVQLPNSTGYVHHKQSPLGLAGPAVSLQFSARPNPTCEPADHLAVVSSHCSTGHS